MAMTPSALDADWIAVCRRSVDGIRELLQSSPSTAERALETGSIGGGGDRTLVIDAGAEAIVFAELDALAAQGHRFVALSEERGEVDFGGAARVTR